MATQPGESGGENSIWKQEQPKASIWANGNEPHEPSIDRVQELENLVPTDDILADYNALIELSSDPLHKAFKPATAEDKSEELVGFLISMKTAWEALPQKDDITKAQIAAAERIIDRYVH